MNKIGSSIGNRPPTTRTDSVQSVYPVSRTSPGLAPQTVVRSVERNEGWQLDAEARGGMGIFRGSRTPRKPAEPLPR